jgi:hypothetical protein
MDVSNLCYDFFWLQDFNENGHIMYTDFIAATIEAHGHIEEDRIAEAFDRLDNDETGFSKFVVSRFVVPFVLTKENPI